MASYKVYAVRSGKHPGLYYSWEECKAEIIGFSNAEYKSFENIEDAQAYLDADGLDTETTEEDIDYVLGILPGIVEKLREMSPLKPEN